MAIKVTKEANKKKPIYFQRCDICGCEFEFEKSDIHSERILIKFIHSQEVYQALETINEFYNKKQKGKVTVVCDFNPYSQI